MTAAKLIDEAIEDQRQDPRERRDIVKSRLIGFYNWLVSEAPKRKGPKGKLVSRGLSEKTGHTYVNAIRSFYGTFDVYVKLKGRSRLPKARVRNKRMVLSNMDVKRLLDHTRSPRDRAIILTLFQGGLDVSTLCDLKYGDVAEGLSRGDRPLKLELYRPKTRTEFYTFIGRDAVDAIRAYLNDLKARGIEPDHNTPLFLKEGHKALKVLGIETHLIQLMMRQLAVKSGLVGKDMNGRDFNPVGPHALRGSFGSILTNKGVPDTVVDFFLGHEIGEMAEAYKRVKFEELKRIYLENERHLSISAGGELEEKLRAEIDGKNRQLQALVNGLAVENMSLKTQMRELGKEVKEFYEGVRKENLELRERQAAMEENMDKWAEVTKEAYLDELMGYLGGLTVEDFKELKKELKRVKEPKAE